MGEVNGRRESVAVREGISGLRRPHLEVNRRPRKTAGFLGFQRADPPIERLSVWAMLAERAGFELSVRTVFQTLEAHTPGLARARTSHIDAAIE